MSVLKQKILDRTVTLGVVGLGYVGLPLAVEKAKAGFHVIGFDVQPQKVDMVNAGTQLHRRRGRQRPEKDRGGRHAARHHGLCLRGLRATACALPCPPRWTRTSSPISAMCAPRRKASCPICTAICSSLLESTTYPGTTEEMLRPILEKSGLKCGVDFFLAFSPERVDPGNAIYKTKNTPKVVGGVTAECTDIAATLYEAVLEAPVHRVSSPAVAEMEKILENTYRNVNIGLINELAILCNRMGINIWEVVEAAKSKPYGFQAFYPGPGLGGHCIPLDPYYLSWKAREFGFHTSMIESSMIINDRMPEYCAQRAMGALNERKKAMNGAKVLVLGVAYKQDIDDYRESPALRVIESLRKLGAQVSYYDPYVESYRYQGQEEHRIPALDKAALESADLVMVTTAHTCVDYDFVAEHASLIFDTKNAMKNVKKRENIRVL